MRAIFHKQAASLQPDRFIALGLSAAVLIAWIFQFFVFRVNTGTSDPVWLQPVAAGLAAAGVLMLIPGYERVWKAMHLSSILLMVWAANGFLFDLLTMAGLIGDPATGLAASVNWPRAIMRTLALSAAIALVRLALKWPVGTASRGIINWYGYAAFVLALPYPVVRIIWAFGGTPGLSKAGAGGEGFAPLILAIPWIMASIISLLFAITGKRNQSRLLLFSGWSAIAIVSSIAPSAFWSIISKMFSGDKITGDISAWVFCLFYGSWFLWTIAAFGAARFYQLNSRVQ